VRARQRRDRARRARLERADDPAAIGRRGRLVVVGPEAPLVAGSPTPARRASRASGRRAAAARLEGSKAHAKEVMAAAGVPTGGTRVVRRSRTGWPRSRATRGDQGRRPRRGQGRRDRADEAEARAALTEMLVEQRFGDVPVVVEEFLEGASCPLLALCDGETALPLAPARDFKRIGDGDTGPNTGGMGAYSPVRGRRRVVEDVRATVHQPVVDELARRGTPFHGVLYAGLMLTADGRRCSSSTSASATRDAGGAPAPAQRPAGPAAARDHARRPRGRDARVGRARGGHRRARLARLPGVAPRRRRDHGSTASARVEVTHAGTAERDGAIVTAGGRVLNVTALGDGRRAARAAAYAAADVIDFDGKTLRGTSPHERAAHDRARAELEAWSRRPRVGIVMGSKSDMPAMERPRRSSRSAASCTRCA
jgi:phosphoribosylamine--glycine ligase